MLARLPTYGLKRVILWPKYKVKSGQYGVLTSPPTEKVACPHATFTLNLSRSTGMKSVNC